MEDNGTQLFGALMSVLNVFVTAGAAFAGAWCTYLFQKRNEQTQLESRFSSNLNLLQGELDIVTKRIGRLPEVFKDVKKHFLSGRTVTTTLHYSEESLQRIRYDIAFLSHCPALTLHLSELIALLDNLKSTVENISAVLNQRPTEIDLEEFLQSREPSFRLSLTQAGSVKELVSRINEEIAEMKNGRLRPSDFFG